VDRPKVAKCDEHHITDLHFNLECDMLFSGNLPNNVSLPVYRNIYKRFEVTSVQFFLNK